MNFQLKSKKDDIHTLNKMYEQAKYTKCLYEMFKQNENVRRKDSRVEISRISVNT